MDIILKYVDKLQRALSHIRIAPMGILQHTDEPHRASNHVRIHHMCIDLNYCKGHHRAQPHARIDPMKSILKYVRQTSKGMLTNQNHSIGNFPKRKWLTLQSTLRWWNKTNGNFHFSKLHRACSPVKISQKVLFSNILINLTEHFHR